MSAGDVLAVVGAVTGSIGAVAGIGGLCVAIVQTRDARKSAQQSESAATESATQARRSTVAAEQSAAAAERSAQAVERAAAAHETAVGLELEQRDREADRWSITELSNGASRLTNLTGSTVYGVSITAGEGVDILGRKASDEVADQGTMDFAAFFNGQGTRNAVLTWHRREDRSDEPRRRKIAL